MSPATTLQVSGGYSEQDDVEYAGRLLDATFFEAYNFSAELTVSGERARSPGIEVLAYANGVDHEMNNDAKPTAQANPNRMPPFPIEVLINASTTVLGGRAAVTWPELASGTYQLGADANLANRDAHRTIGNRSTGITIFEDIVWPDADINVFGLFLKHDKGLTERIASSTTVRVDFVNASAGQVSDFFGQNVSGDLDQSETNLSSAGSLTARLSDGWTGSLGIGTAVRTADALERYSDRFPASKSQMPAEFMGNPELKPERSAQIDLGLEGETRTATFRATAFYLKMKDYITIAQTTLPKRLPLSPDVVFQYRNGDATFYGVEADVAVAVAKSLTLQGSINYLHGEDEAQDEVGSSRVDLQACKLEYSIVSPK